MKRLAKEAALQDCERAGSPITRTWKRGMFWGELRVVTLDKHLAARRRMIVAASACISTRVGRIPSRGVWNALALIPFSPRLFLCVPLDKGRRQNLGPRVRPDCAKWFMLGRRLGLFLSTWKIRGANVCTHIHTCRWPVVPVPWSVLFKRMNRRTKQLCFKGTNKFPLWETNGST